MSLDWSEQPVSPTLGQTLRFQREQLGWTLEVASARIKYSARQIQALEEDRYADLPHGVTLRGMVRNYARAVGLPHEPLLILLEAEISTQTGPVLTEQGRALGAMPHDSLKARDTSLALPVASASGSRRWWVILVAVLLIAGGVFASRPEWRALLPFVAEEAAPQELQPLFGAPNAEPDAPQSFAVPAEPLPQEQAAGQELQAPQGQPDDSVSPALTGPATPGTGQADSATGAASAGGQGSAPNEISTGAAAGASTEPINASAAPAVASDSPQDPRAPDVLSDSVASPLVLRATADSWVELRDASGRVLFSRVLRAGEEFRSELISANLVVGNAAGMVVVWQGQTLDLSAVQRNNVARLTLE